MTSKTVVSYYVRNLRTVLRPPRRLLSFLFAVAMHAFGHAAVALVAGAVAVALAGAWGPHNAPPRLVGGDGPLADKAFFLSLLGLAVCIVKGAAGVYASYVQARVAGEVGSALRLDLLDALLAGHLLRHPRQDDHGSSVPPSSNPAAQGIALLTDRVREVEAGLEQGLLGGARAATQLVALAGILVALSARMAAVAALVLAAFGWALAKARSGYRRATKDAALEREQLLGAAAESVQHADLWVSYGAEPKARATLRALGEAISARSAAVQARAAAQSGANEVLGAAGLVAAIAAYGAGWLGAVAEGATPLAFVIAFFLAYRPLRELAEARLAVARSQGAYEDLTRFVDAGAARAPRRSDQPAASLGARPWEPGPLELRALELARGTRRPLSMRIEAGSVTVLVGPTGVGKTTLLRTLLGFEAAAAGEILFGGEPLSHAPPGPRSRPFAWMPQEAPLLADTLAANVGLGAPGEDSRTPLDDLGAAHLARVLADARLGAGGRTVSGGERQWIALARAVATGLPVLLLDEPTSGLDPDAQRRVLEAIARMRGRRTVLLVTHRAEPLTIADAVLRLDPDPVERAA